MPHFLLPPHLYTSPTIPPLEQTHIFHRTWLYIGDSQHLAPGTVQTIDIANRSILLVRTHTGDLRAYHNVCPHRAAAFCQASTPQPAKHLVCPYHAWVYSLDGELIGTAAQQQFPADFCLADYSLHAVRLETWADFAFICLDADAPPLAEFLSPIPETIQGYRTADTQPLIRKTYTVACNWKVYHDNTLCDYHVAVTHRHTLHKIQGPVKHYEHQFGRFVNLLYTPTTPRWRTENSTLEHLCDRNRLGLFTFGIFPNLHLLALPNGILSWIRIDPVTVDTCAIHLGIYGIPALSPPVDQLLDEFEAFMAEDIAITEQVQRGYASGVYQPGPVHPLEARILHQQEIIDKFLNAAGSTDTAYSSLLPRPLALDSPSH